MSSFTAASKNNLTFLELRALAERLQAHERLIMAKPGGQRAVLNFANLRNLTLRRRRFDEISLLSADLSFSDLSETVLDRALLMGANLANSNFTKASLKRADLRGAALRGVRFDNANLNGADFREATVVFHNEARGWQIVTSNDDKVGAHFIGCSLIDANFNNANLKNACFDGAILKGATFARASLRNASFNDAVLIGVDITQLQVPKECLKNCLMDPEPHILADLPELQRRLDQHETWAKTNGRQGSACTFEGDDLRVLHALTPKRTLTGIKMRLVCCVGLDFSSCELQGADFTGSDLRATIFKNADVRGAIFTNAKLAHSDFEGADISPLRLSNGTLLKTQFDNADLTGSRCLPQPHKPPMSNK